MVRLKKIKGVNMFDYEKEKAFCSTLSAIVERKHFLSNRGNRTTLKLCEEYIKQLKDEIESLKRELDDACSVIE